MVKIKNVSGEDRLVGGRLVLAGAVLEVEAADVESYTCQPSNWALAKSSKSDNNTPTEG